MMQMSSMTNSSCELTARQAGELSVKTQISTAVKLTFHGDKKIVHMEKKLAVQKRKRKKEAPVLVLHRIPAKHMERIHMRLSPVSVA